MNYDLSIIDRLVADRQHAFRSAQLPHRPVGTIPPGRTTPCFAASFATSRSRRTARGTTVADLSIAVNLDVVIAGGGPGGSVAALALARGGARVTLLERLDRPGASVLRASGATGASGGGILLHPNGLAVLYALGLGEALRRRAHVSSVGSIRDERGRTILDVPVPDFGAGLDHVLAVRRSHLTGVLADAVAATPGIEVITGADVIDAHPSVRGVVPAPWHRAPSRRRRRRRRRRGALECAEVRSLRRPFEDPAQHLRAWNRRRRRAEPARRGGRRVLDSARAVRRVAARRRHDVLLRRRHRGRRHCGDRRPRPRTLPVRLDRGAAGVS